MRGSRRGENCRRLRRICANPGNEEEAVEAAAAASFLLKGLIVLSQTLRESKSPSMVVLVTFTAINGSTNLRTEMMISDEFSVAWKRTNACESKAAADDKLTQERFDDFAHGQV